MFRQIERNVVENVNESQSRSWDGEQNQNQIAKDREHGYIPLDPDIDQTRPDPLRLQCRSPSIGLAAIQGLVVCLVKEVVGAVMHGASCCPWLSLAVWIQLLVEL